MSSVVVIRSTWPVVILVCPPRVDLAWITELDRQFGEVFAVGQRFAVISDTSPVVALPSARERRMLADWAGRPDQLALQKRLNVGSSTITLVAPLRDGLPTPAPALRASARVGIPSLAALLIVANPLIRGALQALYWFWTPPNPQHVARDFDGAWGWCIETLREHGVSLPLPAGELKALARRDRAKAAPPAG